MAARKETSNLKLEHFKKNCKHVDILKLQPMVGENRQLVTYEPVEFEK
jgi:hypothetical protein